MKNARKIEHILNTSNYIELLGEKNYHDRKQNDGHLMVLEGYRTHGEKGAN